VGVEGGIVTIVLSAGASFEYQLLFQISTAFKVNWTGSPAVYWGGLPTPTGKTIDDNVGLIAAGTMRTSYGAAGCVLLLEPVIFTQGVVPPSMH